MVWPFFEGRLMIKASLVFCLLTILTFRLLAGELPAPSREAAKPVVYQVFTRLFGNQKNTNQAWGTLAENGVGKFADFTPKALNAIKKQGFTHVWYTGVLHHAMATDYSDYGISADDPDVVKGRAGSPYAIKDYYNVDPDLAIEVENRLEEFKALIRRTHQAGLKVIIDIVPNHVARQYQSLSSPVGVKDFGVEDNRQLEYARDNNFYYVPEEAFKVPNLPKTQVLGGQPHPLADGFFAEKPAKWTGNGARAAQPDKNDWYETVKINFGVKPSGEQDFPSLPASYVNKDHQAHYAFWLDKDLPDTWLKFKDIVLYWLEMGVDGFRYDMAEMVPVAFWSYLNSTIKQHKADAFLLAEVYNPELYRPYIWLGKMDYLYDKVGFYDQLKRIIQGKAAAYSILLEQQKVADINAHMLHFLENHDEQRLASKEFAGDARWGIPAMAVSGLMNQGPLMLYFGQMQGEDGSENAGFGQPSRTSIFDYIGVPAHQAWMNGGAFDGGALSPEQLSLHQTYTNLLPIAQHSVVAHGEMQLISTLANDSVIAFTRSLADKYLLVVTHFSSSNTQNLHLDSQALFNKPLIGKTLLAYQVDACHLDQGQLKINLKPFATCIIELRGEN